MSLSFSQFANATSLKNVFNIIKENGLDPMIVKPVIEEELNFSIKNVQIEHYSDPKEFAKKQYYRCWFSAEGDMKGYDSKLWDVTQKQVTLFLVNSFMLKITIYSPDEETVKEAINFWEGFNNGTLYPSENTPKSVSTVETPLTRKVQIRNYQSIILNEEVGTSQIINRHYTATGLMGAILVKYPELRKVSSNARESAMSRTFENCARGVDEWLEYFGALSSEDISLEDVLHYSDNGYGCGYPYGYRFQVTQAWLYAVSGYINLTDDLSWWTERDEDVINEYINSLRDKPYSQPHFGKKRNQDDDDYAKLQELADSNKADSNKNEEDEDEKYDYEDEEEEYDYEE